MHGGAKHFSAHHLFFSRRCNLLNTSWIINLMGLNGKKYFALLKATVIRINYSV